VTHEATLAAEAAIITLGADDARAARDFERARKLDIESLERAPSHPEVIRRIAEIDHMTENRAEAALALLRSVDRPLDLGVVAADLLRETGDTAGAIATLLTTAEREASSVLAAVTYAAAADLVYDTFDSLRWLDAALAHAPRLAILRWQRALTRLRAGRLADARADFQELEALAHGARERHLVLRRAGDSYRSVGLGTDAAMLYERALLYRPEDPASLAGLGVALAREGRAARGATVLRYAIETAEAQNVQSSWMRLEIARILSDQLSDRPTAIAHLHAISDEAPEAVDARGLEGKLRAELGDIGGSSLAFARMREAARHGSDVQNAVAWLQRAAEFEQSRGELSSAQQHLSAALSLRPTELAVQEAYRAVSAQIAHAAGASLVTNAKAAAVLHPERDALYTEYPPLPIVPPPADALTRANTNTNTNTSALAATDGAPDHATPDESPPARPDLSTTQHAAGDVRPYDLGPGFSLDDPAADANIEAEARIEALTRQLQADPANDAVVDELVELLSGLGRSMELLALLSARLEDAPAERREELLPKHRDVLSTLEDQARRAGRNDEADLFRMAREMA